MTSSPTPANDVAESAESGFWSRLGDKLEPPRLLSLTRAGKFFCLMTIGVGFAAMNTGNNLLFLMLGMMLAVIVASGLLSEAVLRNLVVRRRLPRRIVAGQPAPATLRIINQGWWPALSVEASEQNPRATDGPAAGRTFGPERIPWWKFWRKQTGEDRRPLGAAYCMRVDAEGEHALSPRYELPVRGRFELPGLQLETRFPFALFEKTRKFEAPATITVLPAPTDAHEWIGQLESRWGDTAKNRRGRGEEFYGLREYRPGEDQRLIHWKSTARRGEPVVRETEARQRRALLIVFDNRAPVDEPSADHRERFEEGIRHLAGLAHALRRRGYRLQLATTDDHVVPETAGDIEPLLRHLATLRLQPRSTTAPDASPPDGATRLSIGFDTLVDGGPSPDTSLSLNELAPEDSTTS